MFFISMPRGFKIGDTVDCRVNYEPARVTWRDANCLVIEPDDARPILGIGKEGDLISFACGDAGTTHADYKSEMEPNGGGFFVSENMNRHARRAAKARERGSK
jgi:hypothetical protein